jgi:hypothetical protein
MPLTPPPIAVQGSPGAPSPVMSTHLVAFQALPPPSAQAAHFWPGSQSCLKMSQSTAGPPSGLMMKGRSSVVVGTPVLRSRVVGSSVVVVVVSGAAVVGAGSGSVVAPVSVLAAVVVVLMR